MRLLIAVAVFAAGAAMFFLDDNGLGALLMMGAFIAALLLIGRAVGGLADRDRWR